LTTAKMSSGRRTSPDTVVDCWTGEMVSGEEARGGMGMGEDAVVEDGACGDETLDERDSFSGDP
jgi:hypothetical protein